MAEPATNSKIPLERLDNGRPRFHGCSKITEYEWISKLGEGTFGEVSKARSKKTGQIVALKKILMHHEKDGFPITALREIKLLKQLDHINILKLEEMAVERPKDVKKKPSMFMVTPYMDHDLSGLLENPAVQFSEPQIKCYMKQLLEGCAYLHENKILHRDMKAANLLINNRGILQIADFGLARPYDDDPPTPGQGGGEATREYTTLVVTRWYRPPELLLQLRKYTTAIDMWGVGCVFGEMFKGKPILAGNSDVNQAQLIFDLVGSPTESNMPGWSQLPGCEGVTEFEPRNSSIDRVFQEQSPLTISLLKELLKLDWRKRINAIDALKHPYFHTNPFPARPGDLPSFEESHELDRRKFRDQKNKPPPAPAGGSVGLGPQGEWGINGRPLPYDSRGGNRVPGGSRPYANGHGQGRRPQHPPPPALRNGDYIPDYRGPLIPHEGQTEPYRQPPPYEPPPFNSSRIPPVPTQYDDFSNRQPLPHPQDIGLPPRPPPPSDPYRQAPPPNQHLPYRDDSRVAPLPPRSRVPPTGRRGSDGSTGPSDQSKFQGEVDTYIPSYSNGDPNVRRPPREYFREARTDRDRDGRRDDNRRRDERPLPRQDGPPIDYGEQPPPTRYDDARGRDAGGHGAGMRPGGAPGGAPGAYDRRRSQSPRERTFERDRDRGPRYGQHDDGRYRR